MSIVGANWRGYMFLIVLNILLVILNVTFALVTGLYWQFAPAAFCTGVCLYLAYNYNDK